MNGVFLDVLEVNIVVSVVFLILLIFSGNLRKRYGARWMKLIWGLLVVRLLIPYNFSLQQSMSYSLSFSEVQLFDFQDGRSEELKADLFNGENAVNDTEYPVANTGIEETKTVNHLMENLTRQIIFFDGKMMPLIWIAGIGICLAYCLIGYVYFLIECRMSLHPVTDLVLREQIAEAEKMFQTKANLPVYQSHKVKSPVLVGLLAPKLILPVDKEKWTQAELEFVIAHELCHYRYKDLWRKLFMTVAWCINWFNPLVWILKKKYFDELEFACDGSVLSGYDEEMWENYARVMISFAGKRRGTTVLSTEFGESKKQMKRRIEYMLDSRVKKRGLMSIVFTCVLILSVGLMVSCEKKSEEKDLVESSQRSYSCYQIPLADGRLNWGMNTDEVIAVLGEPSSLESLEYGDTLTYDMPWTGELGDYSQVILYIGIDNKIYNGMLFSSGLFSIEMTMDGETKEFILGKIADFYGELSSEGGETPIEIQLREANADYFYQYHFCEEWKVGTLPETSVERLKQVGEAAERFPVLIDEKTPLMYVNFRGVEYHPCTILLNAEVLSSYLYVESQMD